MLIISQMMVNVGIGVYYHINKEYITKQLCINKNNPSLHCNGHCYLSKQLKKAEEGEKQSTQSFKEKDEIFSNEMYDVSIAYFPAYYVTHFALDNTAKPLAANSNALLKPPSA